jgi:hypothetical protein
MVPGITQDFRDNERGDRKVREAKGGERLREARGVGKVTARPRGQRQ